MAYVKKGLRPFEHFYEPEPNTGCWLWIGTQRKNGYGLFRRRQATRFVLARQMGRELKRHEFACHRCDVPQCVNPDHLFIGTHAENIRDCVAKGRHALKKRTHCNYGHEFTPENTRMRPGNHGRECIACVNAKLERLRVRFNGKLSGQRSNRPRRTHCLRGHALTSDNISWRNNRKARACKQCMHDSNDRFIARRYGRTLSSGRGTSSGESND